MNSLRAVLFALIALLLLTPNRTIAESLQPPSPHGTHAFRYILNALTLKPLTQWDEIMKSPERTALVVMGRTDVLAEVRDPYFTDIVHRGYFEPFVSKGGAVLIATDLATDPVVEKVLGVRVTGKQVRVTDPEQAYRASEEFLECPVIKSWTNGHDLFKDIHSIATNRPSIIEFSGGDAESKLRPAAWFPPWTSRVKGEFRILPSVFAALSDRPEGRLLVLSDHSVFINSMMLQKDDDNFDFAYNCVRWLTENGKRDRILFVNEGVIVENFDVRLAEVPTKLPELTPEVIGKLLKHIQEENLHNELLTKTEAENLHNKLLLENVSFDAIIRTLTLIATVALLGYGLLRLMGARYRAEAE